MLTNNKYTYYGNENLDNGNESDNNEPDNMVTRTRKRQTIKL